MQDQQHLSSGQLTALLVGSMLTPSILMLPGILAQAGGKSGWLLACAAGLLPLCATLLIAAIPYKPDGYGRTAAVLYAGFYLVMSVVLVRLHAELMGLYLFNNTPRWALIAVLTAIGWLAGSLPLNAAGRLNQLLLPVGVPILALFIAAWSMGRSTNLAAALPSVSSLVPGLLPAFYTYAGVETLLYLRPQATRRQQLRCGLAASGWMVAICTLLTATATAVMGDRLAGRLLFPAVAVLKISDFSLASRLELILLAVFGLLALQPIGNYCVAMRRALTPAFPGQNPAFWPALWAGVCLVGACLIPTVGQLTDWLPVLGLLALVAGVVLPAVLALTARRSTKHKEGV